MTKDETMSPKNSFFIFSNSFFIFLIAEFPLSEWLIAVRLASPYCSKFQCFYNALQIPTFHHCFEDNKIEIFFLSELTL